MHVVVPGLRGVYGDVVRFLKSRPVACHFTEYIGTGVGTLLLFFLAQSTNREGSRPCVIDMHSILHMYMPMHAVTLLRHRACSSKHSAIQCPLEVPFEVLDSSL